jgi:hypothetical protein
MSAIVGQSFNLVSLFTGADEGSLHPHELSLQKENSGPAL